MKSFIALFVLTLLGAATARADGFNILDYAPAGTKVDRTGREDASAALAAVITAANAVTATGGPACVYIPSGTYRVVNNPPEFARAGCIKGDGPTQSTIQLDVRFAGDLFTWSEAWYPTTSGPTIVGLRILGSRSASSQQNSFVFYDRNDNVFMDDVEVDDLPGRAFYSGVTQRASKAFMRESHMRSLRFFNDGLIGVPVVEFNSAGSAPTDASNEIRISQVDIYGAAGPSFVIRNGGGGAVRNVTIDAMRIEGREQGDTAADLLTIGDPQLRGQVNTITLTNLELIDVSPNYSALLVTAPMGAAAPYLITVYGFIGGGASKGDGLRIDAGRTSNFHFSDINAAGRDIVIGKGVSQILLDGYGREACWKWEVDPSSQRGILIPAWAQPGENTKLHAPAC